MSRFQPSDKLMIKTNALQLALNTATVSSDGSYKKQTADELLEAAKKIEAYLMEAEVEEKEPAK